VKFPETLYQLDETIPMHKSFMGKFIFGFILAWMSIWFGGFFFKFAFIAGALALLLPLATEFWRGQLKSILLTSDYLEFRIGLEERTQRVYLSEIKRVALIEKEHRSYQRPQPKQEATTVLIEENQVKDYDPETKCIISTSNGKKYEIKSAYFPEGEFGEFLEKLQSAYHGRTVIPKNPNFSPHIDIVQTNATDRIEQVIYSNIKRLQEDLILKKEFEKNMIEAYKSIYRVRDAFDISKIANIKTIYEFKNIDYSTSFILENDYLPELDEEGIEFGINLIDTAKENLALVEKRIAFYKKIDKELEKIKLQQQSHKKLQAVAQNLKDLQEKNTSKIIEQSFTGNSIDLETRILNELEDLSQKVHNIDDLDNAILLKEHISLFKDPS
jgi:hypothetical protein